MRAWAWGERTMAAWWMWPTGGWSSMKAPRPVNRRASSTRLTGLPIHPEGWVMSGGLLYPAVGPGQPALPDDGALDAHRGHPAVGLREDQAQRPGLGLGDVGADGEKP